MLEFEFYKLSYKPYFERTEVQWCTVVQRVRTKCTFPQLFCLLSQRPGIWCECLNLNFINCLINHILKEPKCNGAQWCTVVHSGAQWCTVVHRSAQGAQSAHFPQLFCLLRQRPEIWHKCLNLNFINFLIHHILKKLVHISQLFCLLSQRPEIWYECLNFKFQKLSYKLYFEKTGVQFQQFQQGRLQDTVH